MKALNSLLFLLLVLAFAGKTIGETNSFPAEKGSFVTLKQDDGSELRAFVAGPAHAKAAVLVIHDYFGISDATKQTTERLGALGYRALSSTSSRLLHSARSKYGSASLPGVDLIQQKANPTQIS